MCTCANLLIVFKTTPGILYNQVLSEIEVVILVEEVWIGR
jgi:hypothetical protein